MTLYDIRPSLSQKEIKAFPHQSSLVQKLLFYRGYMTAKDAETFLFPDYENHTHDPFLMKDMELAVKRIYEAVDKGQKIVIYSDYDADGIPGAVIMNDFFELIGYKNTEVYIPHRHNEGYGVNVDAVQKIIEDGGELIITIDCGISDAAAISSAKEKGVDVIVTDHHLPQERLDEAYAIINPKQDDCPYPFDMLCGTGVAYKLIQALLKTRDCGVKPGREKWLLDMVGIATLSDMVPLTGENRVFAYYGLKVLRKSPRPGVVSLLSKLRIHQPSLSEDDIGFMLSPRINAASRMDAPEDAFELLSTKDFTQAARYVLHLNKINDKRKGSVAAIVREIKKRLKERGQNNIKEVIVMGHPTWRPSLLGLAANKVASEYDRPVFLWGRDGNGLIKGSCRSDGTTNLVELMEHAKSVFLGFGGHKMAGGFSVSFDNVHVLEEKLLSSFAFLKKDTEKKGEREDAVTWIDAEMTLKEVTEETWKIVESLGPFGMENPKPLFLFQDVRIQSVRHFGKTKDHLELIFSDNGTGPVKAIGFFMKKEDFPYHVLKEGEKVNLIGTIEKSFFLGRPELRIRIVDLL